MGALIYLLFVAIYYAFSPSTYRRGVIALVPVARRARANAILDQLGTTLRRWVWARMVSMTALGVASSVGLALLGIPLAMTLGLLAGTLLFVPYLGALAAGIPALLIAATVGPYHVLWVLLLYIAIHAADGYLIDPALQRHAVRLPPILVLASQLLFGALWGVIGFTFATPLVGSLVVLVRMIYVEDVLHASDPP